MGRRPASRPMPRTFRKKSSIGNSTPMRCCTASTRARTSSTVAPPQPRGTAMRARFDLGHPAPALNYTPQMLTPIKQEEEELRARSLQEHDKQKTAQAAGHALALGTGEVGGCTRARPRHFPDVARSAQSCMDASSWTAIALISICTASLQRNMQRRMYVRMPTVVENNATLT